MQRRERLFLVVILGCIQFVVLTLAAMLFYAGGTRTNPSAPRYLFFQNFFSELGLTVSRQGEPNTVSAVLFFLALSLAGLALVLFFLLMPAFFRQLRAAHVLSLLGSAAGVVSGAGFLGVALTPANLLLAAHSLFVQLAFLSLFVAVLFYLPAILLAASFPNVYAGVIGVFAVVLAAYLWLLFFGPGPENPQSLTIQATGQKIIGYAAIITVLILADGARRLEAAPRS